MARKKILWLCSWYPNRNNPFDGDFIQRHARAAALYHDIHVIALTREPAGARPNGPDYEKSNSPGLNEEIWYYRGSNSWPGKLLAAFRWYSRYKNAIRNYINTMGRPDLVHVHVPVKAGILALWMRRKYGIGFVVSEHWGIYNDVVADNFSTQLALVQKSTRRVISAAERLLSVSDYLGAAINRMVAKKNYEVIPNAVDTNIFFFKPGSPQKFRFVHVSNLVPLKNIKGIIKALSTVNANIELVIVGPNDPSHLVLAEELRLLNSTVFFRGEVSYEQVAAEMQSSSALVLFSEMENAPCVINEALCCGIPVIASSVGGIAELVNGSNGILVQPRDEVGLAAAMERMMKGYSGYEREKIAMDASANFSYETIGSRFDECYNTVLQGGMSAF